MGQPVFARKALTTAVWTKLSTLLSMEGSDVRFRDGLIQMIASTGSESWQWQTGVQQPPFENFGFNLSVDQILAFGPGARYPINEIWIRHGAGSDRNFEIIGYVSPEGDR